MALGYQRGMLIYRMGCRGTVAALKLSGAALRCGGASAGYADLSHWVLWDGGSTETFGGGTAIWWWYRRGMLIYRMGGVVGTVAVLNLSGAALRFGGASAGYADLSHGGCRGDGGGAPLPYDLSTLFRNAPSFRPCQKL